MRPAHVQHRSASPAVRAMQPHHFWLASLALHALLAIALAQFLDGRQAEAVQQSYQGRIDSNLQAAQQAHMRRRVDQLRAMQELMERIDQAQRDGTPAPEELPLESAPEPALGASAAAGKSKDLNPQQALTQARDLRDRIRALEQQARAKELAQLLKIPEPEALKQVQQEAQQAAAGEDAAAAQSADVAQTLEHYQQQAQEALARRLQQSERQTHGARVQQAPRQDNDDRGPAGSNPAQAAGAQMAGASVRNDPQYSRAASESPPEARQYDRVLPPAPVALADLRLGQGNAVGAGAAFSNRVVIDNWYVIGPFAANNKRSIATLYPPEMLVDLDAIYLGKGGRVLKWQYISAARYPLIPPDPAEKAIYYGYTEIRSDRARDVWLNLGADDDAKLWLNDQLVWTSGSEFKPWYNPGGLDGRTEDIRYANLVEARQRVHLKQGRNTLLFKLYNGILHVFIAVALEPG